MILSHYQVNYKIWDLDSGLRIFVNLSESLVLFFEYLVLRAQIALKKKEEGIMREVFHTKESLWSSASTYWR